MLSWKLKFKIGFYEWLVYNQLLIDCVYCYLIKLYKLIAFKDEIYFTLITSFDVVLFRLQIGSTCFFHLHFRLKDSIHLVHAALWQRGHKSGNQWETLLLKASSDTWHPSYSFIFHWSKLIAWWSLMLVRWRVISVNHIIILLFMKVKNSWILAISYSSYCTSELKLTWRWMVLHNRTVSKWATKSEQQNSLPRHGDKLSL